MPQSIWAAGQRAFAESLADRDMKRERAAAQSRESQEAERRAAMEQQRLALSQRQVANQESAQAYRQSQDTLQRQDMLDAQGAQQKAALAEQQAAALGKKAFDKAVAAYVAAEDGSPEQEAAAIRLTTQFNATLPDAQSAPSPMMGQGAVFMPDGQGGGRWSQNPYARDPNQPEPADEGQAKLQQALSTLPAQFPEGWEQGFRGFRDQILPQLLRDYPNSGIDVERALRAVQQVYARKDPGNLTQSELLTPDLYAPREAFEIPGPVRPVDVPRETGGPVMPGLLSSHGGAAGPAPAAQPAEPPAAEPTAGPQVGQTITLKDGRKARVLAVLPNGELDVEIIGGGG